MFNRHCVTREFLVMSDFPDGHLKLLSTQRFYFDLAEDEEDEWLVFAALAIASLIPTPPIQGLLSWRDRRRRRRPANATE